MEQKLLQFDEAALFLRCSFFVTFLLVARYFLLVARCNFCLLRVTFCPVFIGNCLTISHTCYPDLPSR